MQELCESVLKNPFLVRTCGCAFDRRTRARLERENRQTWRALKKREQITNKETAELQQRGENGDGKELGGVQDTKGTAARRHYRFTKWSKLKMLRARKENERWETYLHHYKKWKFFTSLIRFKIALAYKDWDHTCHLKERTIIRQNIRLEHILRIRWRYKIDESLPADSIIFDNIMRYEQKKKKQLKLRQERMISIIKKIVREMNNDIRVLKKRKTGRRKEIEFEGHSEESFVEVTLEEFHDENLEDARVVPEKRTTVIDTGFVEKDEKVEDSELRLTKETKYVKVKKDVATREEKEEKVEAIAEDGKDLEKSISILKESKSSVQQVFPEDACFFAIPSLVTIDDFEVGRVYSRKATIRNKTAKWAYLRFHKIYTEVWEPGIVQIDTMDAARVNPGLDVPVNVKFSPIHEEEVTAEIAFLTLTADDTKTFHEFRVPVRCTPQSAVPFLDPKELRFPTAPIWKYDDSKFSERILTILNDGRKPFSVVIEERNERDHCFLWHFDQAEIQSVQSSILCTGETGNVENLGNGNENMESMPGSRNFGKLFQIEVPSQLKCNLRITFRPRYAGLHHEVFDIYFLRDGKLFDKQSVPIWTEVTGCQIHLDPPCVDLGIVMIDSDICQQTFDIFNSGRFSVEVLLKTPKCLGNQVSVHPKSTVVQPDASFKIAVRLIPGPRIVQIAKRFYDSVSNMLEFPIQVQILSQDSEKPPPLTVKILATLTTCRGLILEPANVDLGFVHTHESVYAELSLTNESLLTQEFAFLNLPPSVEVQPNHGFGAILPGETIKLHLIYSPCSTDIPGNDVGANGLAGERSFLIEVVTLAELAGSKKEAAIDRLKNQIERQGTNTRNRGFPPPFSIDLQKPKTIRQAGDDAENRKDVSENDSLADEKSLRDKEEILNVFAEEELSCSDERKEKNAVEVYAYIIDTFCELSEQVVEFPATPCGSFSMVSIHLRGFNTASYPHCTCGILKNQAKEFVARYEFKSSSARLKIMPESGMLRSNEIIEVNLLFKPRLPNKMIFEEGLRLKMNVEEQEAKSEQDDKSSRKGKGKKRKAAKKETTDKKRNVSEVDRLAGEVSLLETLQPCICTIHVTCAIDLELKNGTKRDELLFVKLICPITRPEILLLNEGREISFGSTAIGTSVQKLLFVKNISTQSVKVDVSVPNPFGPFFIPPGRTIETGSILKLPVTYRPTQEREEEDQEYLEVSSAKSRTRWIVEVSGRGVAPSYVLKPLFRVARFEVTDEKPVELTLSVQNTGACPLILRTYLADVLEGEIAREMGEESAERSSKKKRKEKKDGASSGKSSRKGEFEDKLRPNEELAIFGGNLQRSADSSRFSFWNLDENNRLVVAEKKKMDFGVRFQWKTDKPDPDSNEITETTPKAQKKKTKKGKQTDESRKPNYCYVAIVKLTLGATLVNECIMICSLK